MKIALFTNNYLPFRGGVTTSVETLRRGLDARGHEAWVFAPRFRDVVDAHPRIVRYPSLPAATYPDELYSAAGMVRGNQVPPESWLQAQPWDSSVKSLAHTPSVLTWMAQNADW